MMSGKRKHAHASDRHASLPAALMVLAAALAACGGGRDADAPPVASAADVATPMIDPCTLLTTAEVQQELGWTATAATDTVTMPGRGNCEYASTAGDRKLWLFLGPSTSQPSRDHYRMNAESYTKDMGFEEIEFIDDIGSAAMWVPEGRQLTAVVPRYEIQVIDMTAQERANLTLPQARALLQKAMARLD
jgi:hypothetical protein